MREAQFLKQNADKWKQYEAQLNADISTDTTANRFAEVTDDLAYARTFYPHSNTAKYLNGLAAQFHQKIYRNKKEKKELILRFCDRVLWYRQLCGIALISRKSRPIFLGCLELTRRC